MSINSVDMSDSPGHFMLFCKLQKGGQTDSKKSKRGIQNPIQIGSSGIWAGNRKYYKGVCRQMIRTHP